MRAIGLWLRRATKKTARLPSWANPIIASAVIFSAIAWTNIRSESMPERRLDGFNVIATAADPFGSAAANLALTKAKEIGASAVAVIPFLWQPNATSPDLARGNDMNDDELRAAIREAHALGLAVLVKPHVWVPQSWAGAVTMHSQADWQQWFASYQREITHIAQIAESEKAEALAIGTELSQTTLLPQWNDLIVSTRAIFSGRLLYVAHNVEEAETVPFWDSLDAIGVSLYPPLGNDDDRDYRRAAMRAAADRLDMLAVIYRKPVADRRNRAALRRRRCGETLGKCGRTRGHGRSGASSRRACRLADSSRSADNRRRHDLALVHRSQCRRIGRHRFHRAGQACRTRSAMRLDTRLRPRLRDYSL